MRPSSLSSITAASTGSLHAPQHQLNSQPRPQNDYAGDGHRQYSDIDSPSDSDSDPDLALRDFEPQDESPAGRRFSDVWRQASSSASMTADTVAVGVSVGAAAGSVHRPTLLSRHLRQSYVDEDDDAETDSSYETDSESEPDSEAASDAATDSDAETEDEVGVDNDGHGGAPLATSYAAAATSHSAIDDDADLDSEYDSEDDYTVAISEYYNQLSAAQPLFSVIPSAAQQALAGHYSLPHPEQLQQPQPTPHQHTTQSHHTQQHDTQPHAPQPQTQPHVLAIPSLANLPPLPHPPSDWAPLPPMLDDPMPDIAISNANPAILGSENFGLIDFLRDWSYQGRLGRGARSQPPNYEQVWRHAQADIDEVEYSDLKGDECDVQGMDWSAMETTRQAARLRRQHTYSNYVNRLGSDKWASQRERALTASNGSFFRFKRMNIRKDVTLAHFQLRSVLACPTRTHAYYPSPRGIARLNTTSRKSDLFMNLRDFPANGAVISTVDAACGVLMCGTFNGDYCLKSLDSSDKQAYTEGRITDDISGITNHIKIHQSRRSAGPVAAIASNDHGFRLLDLETQKFTQETMYPFALNCTALSPDRRLRAVVGDDFNVFITNADTGEIQRELTGHRDYGFACDWSDDGWTVATGFQDMAVKIWDARRWCNSSGISTPLCTVRTEMAGARSLRFSPVGAGRPVLVAAEEADYINIIDAKTFRRKQVVDVFGEIGGVSFANDGHDLNVLCCDSHRGGLLQLERCGHDFADTPAHEMPVPF